MTALLNYIYTELVFNGALISGILFGLIFLAFHFKILSQKACKIITIIFIVLCTGISIEFYTFQISQSYTILLIPISILVIMVDFFFKSITTIILKIILSLNLLYLAIGLALLASSNNTWGNIGSITGMFIVPNTLLIVMYFLCTIKNYLFLAISLAVMTVLSILFLYLVTNGFQYMEYDGALVREKRWIASGISLLFFLNGIAFFVKRKAIESKEL